MDQAINEVLSQTTFPKGTHEPIATSSILSVDEGALTSTTDAPQYGDYVLVGNYYFSDYQFFFFEGQFRTTMIDGPGLNRFILDENSGWADPKGNTWYINNESSIVMYDDWNSIIQSCLEQTNEVNVNTDDTVPVLIEPIKSIYSQLGPSGNQVITVKFSDGSYFNIYRSLGVFNVYHSGGYVIASHLSSGDSFTFGKYTYFVYLSQNIVGSFYVDIYE